VPTMQQIYQAHSDRYDALVDREDWRKNLAGWLLSSTEWAGRAVIEAGAGTGRVTEIYAPLVRFATCFDRSEHMLQAARRRLKPYLEKLSFATAENLSIPELPHKCDVFIEGWSFGHTVEDSTDPVEQVTELLLRNACRNLSATADVFIIETLGTNTPAPDAPSGRLSGFYRELQENWGFVLQILSTDYKFETVEDASETLGFFFGEEMRERILSGNQTLIPEWTGVWHAQMGAGQLRTSGVG
jgi:SAM-dependent methyltransferase